MAKAAAAFAFTLILTAPLADQWPLDVAAPLAAAESELGDADCDGEVNSIDALLVLQLHAGLTPTLPCPGAGDVNGDGRVDSVDAALILQLDACPLIEPWFCR